MKKIIIILFTIFINYANTYTIQAPWTKTNVAWSTNVTYQEHENHYTFSKMHLESSTYKNIPSRGFIFVPGLGDVPLLMGPLEHGKFMPTNHWHTVYFHDAHAEQTLSTSLGQDCEIISVLKTIKAVHSMYDSLAIMGESRGGAAAVNTIAVLAQPHHKLLKQVDITEQERLIIMQKIQNGCVVLRVPLISFQDAATIHTNNALGNIIHFIIAPLVTNFHYHPRGKQVINSLKYWHHLHIPTLIFFASHDLTLGDNLNDQFIKKFKEKNGEMFTWHYTFEGCHIKSGDLQYEQMLPYFFTHRTIKGFEYNPKKQLVYQWIENK